MTPEIARAFNHWQKQHPLTRFGGATTSWAQAAFVAGVEHGAKKERKGATAISYEVVCRACGRTEPLVADNGLDAATEAKEKGWPAPLRHGEGWLCPKCKTDNRGKEKP